MGVPPIKQKVFFKPTRGIDLKSSEQIRSENYLSMALNVCYDPQQNIIKRPGSQLKADIMSASWGGLTKLRTSDIYGNSKEELLILGSTTPKKLVKNTLTITNNTLSPLLLTWGYNVSPAGWYWHLTGAAIAAMNVNIAAQTVTQLAAALPAGVVGTISANGGMKAIYLDLVEAQAIPVGSSYSIPFYSTENLVSGMNTTGTGVLPSFTPNTLRAPISTAVSAGSVYWYSGSRDSCGTNSNSQLMKYDGQTYYRAGLPVCVLYSDAVALFNDGAAVSDARGTFTLSGAGATSYLPRNMYARYVFVDAPGVQHTGDFSEYPGVSTSVANYNNQRAGVRINYITVPLDSLKNYSINGFNARGALAAGSQGPTLTINVDNGAGGADGLLAGDVAYFWDRVQAKFIQRKIVSRGASSITLSTTKIDTWDTGGNVSVYDNAVISNNFRIQMFYADQTAQIAATGHNYSRIISGSLIVEVPFNPYADAMFAASSQVDWVYESNNGQPYQVPDSYSWSGSNFYPPQPGYLVTTTSNGNALLTAGKSDEKNLVFSSSDQDCEAFYVGRNTFAVDAEVTALSTSGGVAFVATSKSTYGVMGDVPNLNFKVEKITENAGVLASGSTVEINESLVAFNTDRGVYGLFAGREFKPLGEWPQDKTLCIIEPYFTRQYKNYDVLGNLHAAPLFQSALSQVIPKKKWLICSIPWATPTAGGTETYTFDTGHNTLMVFDYGISGWFVWQGLDASAGIAEWDGKVWTLGSPQKEYVSLNCLSDYVPNTGFNDSGSSYNCLVRYHWETGGVYNIYKKFLWCVFTTPLGTGSDFDITVKNYANYEIADDGIFHYPVALSSNYTVRSNLPQAIVQTKFKSAKMGAMQLELNNSNINEQLCLGPIEIDISPVFTIPGRPGALAT